MSQPGGIRCQPVRHYRLDLVALALPGPVILCKRSYQFNGGVASSTRQAAVAQALATLHNGSLSLVCVVPGSVSNDTFPGTGCGSATHDDEPQHSAEPQLSGTPISRSCSAADPNRHMRSGTNTCQDGGTRSQRPDESVRFENVALQPGRSWTACSSQDHLHRRQARGCPIKMRCRSTGLRLPHGIAQ